MFRERVARVTAVLSLALLGSAAVAVMCAWGAAAYDGRIPLKWGTFEGNHGPWRQYSTGRQLIEYSITLSLAAMVAAIISLPLKRSVLAAVVVGLSLLSFFLILTTHFWLID